MKTTKTIYDWPGIFNLAPGTRFTDSRPVAFVARGEGRVEEIRSGDLVPYSDIELPVTYEANSHITRLRVVKVPTIERWIAIGHGVYKSFHTHREAISWAQKRVRR